MVDEMKLSESFAFNRQQMTFNLYVYLGEPTPDNLKGVKADHALVLMFQPFRGQWVQVLGCFLSKDAVTSEILLKLILECILLLSNCGFHVDVVTSDGAHSNRGVWTIFGINPNNLSCPHPCDSTKKLWMIADFPHLIKTFRNGLVKESGFLVSYFLCDEYLYTTL